MCNCLTGHMLYHSCGRLDGYATVRVQIIYIVWENERGSKNEHYRCTREKVAKEGKMKAVVSITIDDEFVVHDIKVIEGEKGLFIAMPSRKATDGEYRDIAHPINSATRDRIQRIILDKYDEVMAAEPEEAMEA